MAGCARAVAASLILALGVLGQASSAGAETLIVTDQGEEYAGDVIAAGVNTLTMKLTGSGYQIVPTKSIARVSVAVQDSPPIDGKLIDWSDGEVTVRVGDRDVAVRNGVITSVTDVGVAAGGPVISPPPQPAADEQPSTTAPAVPETVPSNATM